jgi:hypothetical protein
MRETIILNEVEQVLCHLIAKERFKQNRQNGVIDNKIGPQSTDNTDLEGIGAEIAFCKYANLYPDFTIGPRKGGFDCISKTGLKVDVKQTSYKNGHLLAVAGKKKEDAEVYVLMIGTFPNYEYKGFATKDMLINNSKLKSFGYKPTFALSQDELLK